MARTDGPFERASRLCNYNGVPLSAPPIPSTVGHRLREYEEGEVCPRQCGFDDRVYMFIGEAVAEAGEAVEWSGVETHAPPEG